MMPLWGNPLFLIGLAAAALPLLAHLLTRARPRTIRFPAFALLLEAGGGRQTLSRLRTITLLLLRSLLLAAVALLFAKPFLPAAGLLTASGSDRRVVLIVDSSLSMNAAPDGISLFTRATAQAADLLRALPDGAQAALIFAGRTPSSVLPALTRNLPLLHKELEKSRCTVQSCDTPAALALAAELLDKRGEVFLFSDFQRTSWAAADFSHHPGLTFLLKPTSDHSCENAGVSEVTLSPAEPLPGEQCMLTARVFNSTPTQRSLRICTELASGTTQEQEVQIPPFSSATGTFSLSLPAPGIHTGKVTIAEDALNEDNARVFYINVRPQIQTLLVSDEANRPGSPAQLAGLAFSPPGSSSGIRLLRRHSSEIDAKTAAECQAFLLVPPTSLDAGTAGLIAARIRDGASAFIFFSTKEDLAGLERLTTASNGAITLPFAVTGEIHLPSPEASVNLSMSGRSALALFSNPAEADLRGICFSSYLAGNAHQPRAEEIWLTYPDGSPALALSPAGRGKVVYLNLNITPAQGTLCGSPLFPALLRELLQRTRSGTGKNEGEPGLAWTLLFANINSNLKEPIRVCDPAGQPVEPLLAEVAGKLTLPPAQICGIYTASDLAGHQTIGTINPDPRESDLRPMPPASLRIAGASVTVVPGHEELLQAGLERPLWPALLLLAILAVFMESVLCIWWRKSGTGITRGTGGAK